MRLIKDNVRHDSQVILVGHHLGETNEREVSTEEAMSFAADAGLPYIEANPLTGFKVDQIFIKLTEYILDKNVEEK